MRISGRLTKRTGCRWIRRCRSISTSRSGTDCSRRASRRNQMSDFTLSYALNGPANGKPSWWSPDNANFAPRFGLAYAPVGSHRIARETFRKDGRLPRRRRYRLRSVRKRFDRELRSDTDRWVSPIRRISPIPTASRPRRDSRGHIRRCRLRQRAGFHTRRPRLQRLPALSWAFRRI